MGYDIYIKDEDFGITYNVAPMFYKHNVLGIRFIYEKSGIIATPMLLDMYTYFVMHKEELETLIPENGWGSYDNTVDVLHKMIKASTANPYEVWKGD